MKSINQILFSLILNEFNSLATKNEKQKQKRKRKWSPFSFVWFLMNYFPYLSWNMQVTAIMGIKSSYIEVGKYWQGDPCIPKFPWNGLKCRNNGYNPPQIISLWVYACQKKKMTIILSVFDSYYVLTKVFDLPVESWPQADWKARYLLSCQISNHYSACKYMHIHDRCSKKILNIVRIF